METKKEIEAFNKLWKVKVLRELKAIEFQEGFKSKVTRDLTNDIQRAIMFMRYGFMEGIEFEKTKTKK